LPSSSAHSCRARGERVYIVSATLQEIVQVIADDLGNESIGVRSVCYLPLTYDHRLIDGAVAASFLVTMKKRLEEGRFEADLGLAPT